MAIPGRAASSVLANFRQKRNGSYRVVLGPETRALAPYEAWSGVPAASLGYDLENAQTIVSFGAPLLDGWGTPGRFTRLWAERAAGKSGSGTAPDSSGSISFAHRGACVAVDTDSGWAPSPRLAAGVARVLLEEHLLRRAAPCRQLTLAEAAAQTGLQQRRFAIWRGRLRRTDSRASDSER